MKIQYKFIDETVEIEVADEWGNLVIDLNRQEYNNDHAETRRHASLSAMHYEGDYFSSEDPALAKLAEYADLHKAISNLPPRQREVIHLYFFEGLNMVEIADHLGIHPTTVREALNAAKKNLRKIL